MKVIIQTTVSKDGWRVEIQCPTHPSLVLAARQLAFCGQQGERFPDPVDAPAAIRALCQSQPGERLPVQQLYDRCRAGMPNPSAATAAGDVEIFGRYLSWALLGPYWLQMAQAADTEDIALMLQFEPTDTELARLPWEMMSGDQVPLAADPDRTVAIARIVPGKAVATEPLELPLRVLFVVGRQLDDALRPGAEYLGLLRHLKSTPQAQAPEAELNVSLLTEATTDEIEDAMTRFRPHVVHFICHGASDPDGGKLLLTKRATEVRTSAKTLQPNACGADTLFGLLGPVKDTAGNRAGLPSVVVVNACHSGDVPGATDEANAGGTCQSLVARLVALGVPMAIGMTGEVADCACRLFTGSFYRALLGGQCVALAAAKGRRAGMLHYGNYRSSVEWARASLFVRDHNGTHLDLKGVPTVSMPISGVVARYRQNSDPLFGRLDCLREYEEFRAAAHDFCSRLVKGEVPVAPRLVLAYGVEADEPIHAELGRLRFGKTPLLQELAAQSVLDGFIPCVLHSRGVEPPVNVGDFALSLADAMDKARDYFGAPPLQTPSRALKIAALLCDEAIPAGLELAELNVFIGKVRKALKSIDTSDGNNRNAFKEAIADDFQQLRKDLGEMRHPLVLIDDLHRYEGVLGALQELELKRYGFGSVSKAGQRIAVPLIFTHSTKLAVGRGAEEIKKLLAGMQDTARRVALGKLDVVPERLAFSQCLLSLPQCLAVNSERGIKDLVARFLSTVAKKTLGVPSVFLSERVRGMVDLAKDQQVLLDADEETIFKALAKRD